MRNRVIRKTTLQDIIRKDYSKEGTISSSVRVPTPVGLIVDLCEQRQTSLKWGEREGGKEEDRETERDAVFQ